MKVTTTAFRATFGIALGAAAAYVLAQITIAAVDEGAIGDTAGWIGKEWKTYRAFRRQTADHG